MEAGRDSGAIVIQPSGDGSLTARPPGVPSSSGSQSPIQQFLDALDQLDVDAAMAVMAPTARVLVADGRRAEGAEAVRELFRDLLAQLRTTTHRITHEWHMGDVWIAEVNAAYELLDWLQINAVPRAFVVRAGAAGIVELSAYGAHEHRLSEHRTGEEGMWVGGRWAPPL